MQSSFLYGIHLKLGRENLIFFKDEGESVDGFLHFEVIIKRIEFPAPLIFIILINFCQILRGQLQINFILFFIIGKSDRQGPGMSPQENVSPPLPARNHPSGVRKEAFDAASYSQQQPIYCLQSKEDRIALHSNILTGSIY